MPIPAAPANNTTLWNCSFRATAAASSDRSSTKSPAMKSDSIRSGDIAMGTYDPTTDRYSKTDAGAQPAPILIAGQYARANTAVSEAGEPQRAQAVEGSSSSSSPWKGSTRSVAPVVA
jgi:hypothetical protein